jgi:hypothetical protein
MNRESHLRSLTEEIHALKNRVRDIIGPAHWQSDGEWKESVLRTALRRHVPRTVCVGRAFVVGKNELTRQIDILLYRSDCPILYQDADFVLLTPDAVLATIEVKTRQTNAQLIETIENAVSNTKVIVDGVSIRSPFTGVFVYEGLKINTDQILKRLDALAEDWNDPTVNALCVGKSLFMRFWEDAPSPPGKQVRNVWRTYYMENMAPAYFAYSVVDSVVQSGYSGTRCIWFPGVGKDKFMTNECARKDHRNRQ